MRGFLWEALAETWSLLLWSFCLYESVWGQTFENHHFSITWERNQGRTWINIDNTREQKDKTLKNTCAKVWMFRVVTSEENRKHWVCVDVKILIILTLIVCRVPLPLSLSLFLFFFLKCSWGAPFPANLIISLSEADSQWLSDDVPNSPHVSALRLWSKKTTDAVYNRGCND